SGVLSIEEKKIGIDTGFFDLGGHSLKAILMLSKIYTELSVNIAVQEIFVHRTIRELSEFIRKSTKKKFTPIEPVARKEYYELSFNQNRLWIMQQRDTDSNAFNMPDRIVMGEIADATSIKQTVAKLIERHESLRTGFKEIQGEAVQFIVEDYDIPFESVDISSLRDEREKQTRLNEIIRTFSMTPFDLERPPLLNTLLIKVKDDYNILAYNTHHIISDGWSSEILERDFHTIYQSYLEGKPPVMEDLTVTYKDFSAWQNRRLKDPSKRRTSHRFWKEFLKDQLPPLRIPGDFEDPDGDKGGLFYRFLLPGETKDALKTLSKKHNITLFALMYSIYNIFLSMVSGQTEVVSTIINAGRHHPSLNDIVGFFVNPVIVKKSLDGEEVFIKFAAAVQALMLKIFKHQNYPLELVLDEVGIKYPEVSTAFNMLNSHDHEEISLENIESGHLDNYPIPNVKFDIQPFVSEYKNAIQVDIAYNRNRFKPQNIEFMMQKYRKLIDFFALNPQSKIEDYRETRKRKFFKPV
ncbi:MAG: hypothetical protein GY940_18880, partial [bacterium]|nr:hypothetical protein [bacterium]